MPHPYKHAVISALVIFACILQATRAQSPQVSYLLDNTQSGSTKNYVARDEIVMKPGFVYSASGSNTFSAKIDAGLLFPPTENTYALPNGTITTDPTQGAVVGSIPGQFAVSPSGAATYTIPIECPPGINGMQPSVSLVYNSQGGNGIAGWGWNIGGLSMISRIPRNHYYDNKKTGIIWDNTSPLALDGQRLIEIQSWGTDSIEYDTEAKSGARIVGYNIMDWGAEYFKVYTKSGQTIQYGSFQNMASYSLIYNGLNADNTYSDFIYNLSWSIVSIIDNNSNIIEFEYDNTIWEPTSTIRARLFSNTVIKKIKYGTNTKKDSEDIYSITFNYDERLLDVQAGKIDGMSIVNDKILSEIIVKNKDNIFRKYSCEYEYQDNRISHLKQVKLYNGNNNTINPIEIKWENNNYSIVEQQHISYPKSPLMDSLQNGGYNHLLYLQRRIFANIDGDDDQDAIFLYKLTKRIDNTVLGIHISYDYEDKYVFVVYKNNNGSFNVLYDKMWDIDYESNAIAYDKDNDGKDELFIATTVAEELDLDTSWASYICYKYVEADTNTNTPESFGKSSLFTDFTVDNCYSKKFTVFPGDFLGTGEPQFFSLSYDDYYEGYVYPKLSGHNADISYHSKGIKDQFIIDDIKEDHVGSAPYFKVQNGCSYDIYLTDINGNGKQEITLVNCDGLGVWEFVEKSTGGYKLERICTLSGMNGYYKVFPGDFNGDGNTDLLVQTYPGYTWELYVSDGITLSKLTTPYTNISSILNSSSYLQVYDANNDGKSDILVNNYIDNALKLYISAGGGFFYLGSTYSTEGTDFITGFYYLGPGITSQKNEALLCAPFSNNNNAEYGYDILLKVPQTYNIVKSVYDSFKNKTNITYDLFNSNSNKRFEFGNGDNIDLSKTHCSQTSYGTWNVVKDVKTYTSTNQLVGSMTYTYDDAIFHKQGKGFLGYLNQTIKDNINGIEKSLVNALNDTKFFIYPVCKTSKIFNSPNKPSYIVSMSAGTLISSETSEFETITSGKFYSLNIKSQTSYDGLNNLTRKIEYKDYDSWGNPHTIITTQGLVTDTKTITYVRKGAWCDNKISSIISEKKFNNDTYIRKLNYEYDSKGNLRKEISDQSDPNELTTEYSNFDDFGHPQAVSVTTRIDETLKTRTTETTYDDTGLYVETKKNVLGEITTYDWDKNKNQLNYEKDQFNRTTYLSYDNWGNVTETYYPDGNRVSEILQWAGSNDYGATYYSYSQNSGSAPVKVWYDALGRELVKEATGFDNKKVRIFTQYLSNGKVHRVSEPTFNTSPARWAATYSYDNLGRVVKIETPAGNTETTYESRKTTVTSPEGTQITQLDNSGQLASSSVNGKTVYYSYYASGLIETSTPEGGNTLTNTYDLQGNRIKLEDPDAGIIESKYNGFGELMWEKHKVHATGNEVLTKNNLDWTTGLMLSTERGVDSDKEITTYSYNATHKGLIEKIEITGKHNRSFKYDNFDRVTEVQEWINNRTFTKKIEFDVLGRVKKEIYPSGFYTLNKYDQNGILTEIKDNANRSIWRLAEENEFGQIKRIFKGDQEVVLGYHPDKHLNTSIKAGSIIDYEFDYNSKNNLLWRRDNLTTQREDFEYDGLNRLTDWKVTRNGVQTNYELDYDPTYSLNIKTKSGVELNNNLLSMSYGITQDDEDITKPHALSSISGVPASFPTQDLNITYTDFKKIHTLIEGNKTYTVTYGVDEQRRMSVYKVGNETKMTRYYLGNYEEEIGTDNKIRKIHYLSGAIFVDNETSPDSLYYTYSDNQGSLIAITDQNGVVKRKYAYDPWGSRRNPTNWTEPDNLVNLILNRGYTGHEHLDIFGIINMNGRVYDPLTAQFLSPDPFIQAPGNWLNYNRYSYCIGNPLKYTDPTGNVFGIDDAMMIAGVAMIIREGINGGMHAYANNGNVAIGVVGGVMMTGVPMFLNSLLGMGISEITGVIGDIFGHKPGSLGMELLRAGTHGSFNGMITLVQGGNFWEGFAVGAVSSLAGSGMQKVGVSDALIPLGTGLAGAGTAALTGGDAFAGFMAGYGIGKYNHSNKGRWTQTNTGELEFVLAEPLKEIIVTPRKFQLTVISWISQYDKRVPGYGDSACKRACYIMAPNALRGMSNGYFIAREKGQSFVATNDFNNGIQYLNEQLSEGNPTIVGVGRHSPKYFGRNINGDFTTDHFVVVDRISSTGYHFLDPGTNNLNAGTSPNNLFRLGENGLYTGRSYGSPMTITWIGFNK